ncbi:hypothetical protein ALPO108162_10490 [Alicyclobacillus pomorum]
MMRIDKWHNDMEGFQIQESRHETATFRKEEHGVQHRR